MEQIIFDSENGEQIPFFVIEETTINEVHYLLVSDEDPDTVDSEGEASILKCVSTDGEEETYEFVEDDAEWEAVLNVFKELLDDLDLED